VGRHVTSFLFRPSVSASGGLLIIWNSDEVVLWSSCSDDHLLLIYWKFIVTYEEFYLINIYAPYDMVAQQLLWDGLFVRIGNYEGRNLCVCRDFNVVGSLEERRGVSTFQRMAGCDDFNRLIDDSSLIDFPLVGPRFTWFRVGSL
jgi:hypothetical protein